MIRTLFLLLFMLKCANSFIFSGNRLLLSNRSFSPALHYFPDDHSNLLISAGEIISNGEAEWRQYVPLVAASTVILDIILGQPLLKIVTAPMRRASGLDDDAVSMAPNNKPKFNRNEKERVDSNALAQAAVERARNSMELRRFLEENKSDEQRYEDKRKEIQKQMEALENRLSSLNLKSKDE